MFIDYINFLVPTSLCLLIAGQAIYVALYLRQRQNWQRPPQEYAPPAAIILCLRGRDPTLGQCLNAIANLNYPYFELHTVFDSDLDPAQKAVQQFQQSAKFPVFIHTITEFSGQCGMKCQAINTAIAALPASIEVVALVDADSIVAPNWLTEIVRPLQFPEVGAVTGDRWFEPSSDFASVTRAVWNAAAIVQMNLYQIAWGGSLAMRRDTILRLELPKIWSHTFCEDTVLVDLFQSQGLKVVRPRDVVVFNRETIEWKNLHFWIARQLLTVRLHNKKWPLVFGHGLLVGASLFLSLLLLPINIILGNSLAAVIILGVILACELFNFVLVIGVNQENVKILVAHKQVTPPGSLRRLWWMWLIAIPLTQVTHFLSTLRALTMKYVIWRGIEYQVTPEKVTVMKYRPFLDRNAPHNDLDSVH